MKGNFKPWAPTQNGQQKTVRFGNDCQKKGKHSKLVSQEDSRRRNTRSATRYVPQKNFAPIREYGTTDTNCSSKHNQNVDLCPDSDDVNIPLNKLPTTEDGTWKDESSNVAPLEPNFISTTKAWVSKWRDSVQLESLMMNCLTLFRWVTKASKVSFIFSILILYPLQSFYSLIIIDFNSLPVYASPNHRQKEWIEKPANNNNIAVTWVFWCELRDLRMLCPGHTKEMNTKTRTNSSLPVETKDTSKGAHIHDGQSSEPFYPTFKILTIIFFKVRFWVVEILLVARHEMSLINSSPAFNLPKWEQSLHQTYNPETNW